MKKRTVFIIFLLLLAALLRFYRIGELTEFLGDQGRTGILIWNAWTNKNLPLVGPSVLSGQYLGPFFYYFIALPFIISNFHPLAPALWMATFGILSVFLVFYVGEKLFEFWIGSAIATLYAVSPYIISSDRTLWEPNIVHFFILLYILCVYLVQNERKFTAFFPMGILVGILVQLHYPNIFFIALSNLFWFFILINRKKSESKKEILLWSIAGIVGFFVILSPFLYYESQHSWKDVRDIILIFLAPSASSADTLPFGETVVDLSTRVFKKVIPLPTFWVAMGELIILTGALLRRRFWGFFFSFWFIVGIIAMSLYRGIVFDHYLHFLLPVPFFLLGFVISSYRRFIPSILLVSLIAFFLIFHIRNADIFAKGNNDIARAQSMIARMLSLTKNESFSFTLSSSRSFSDLHYRYFFLTNRIKPVPIMDMSYPNLFLICEKAPCASPKEMKRKDSVPVLCYEEYCSGPYPMVDLRSWQFATSSSVFDGRIYMYRRKTFGGDTSFPVQ